MGSGEWRWGVTREEAERVAARLVTVSGDEDGWFIRIAGSIHDFAACEELREERAAQARDAIVRALVGE